MVEVFKTNVTSIRRANNLADVIQQHFKDYKVNFDLDDCDHILRIESPHDVDAEHVIEFLKYIGVTAEVLLDEPFLLIIS